MMMKPDWRKVELVKIDAKPTGLWNLALDYVSGPRLLRFRVVNKNEQEGDLPTLWNPTNDLDSGPDGTSTSQTKSGLLNTGSRYGALIGKIGGSTADVPDSSQIAAPYGTKKVFAVGSYCVILVAAADGGPLFLTMNDSPDGFKDHAGALHVQIEEYPL